MASSGSPFHFPNDSPALTGTEQLFQKGMDFRNQFSKNGFPLH